MIAAALVFGLIALVQGVAWLGQGRGGRQRLFAGALLAPCGLAGLAWGLLRLVIWMSAG